MELGHIGKIYLIIIKIISLYNRIRDMYLTLQPYFNSQGIMAKKSKFSWNHPGQQFSSNSQAAVNPGQQSNSQSAITPGHQWNSNRFLRLNQQSPLDRILTVNKQSPSTAWNSGIPMQYSCQLANNFHYLSFQT